MPEWIDVFGSRMTIAAFLRSGVGLVAGILTWDPAGTGVLHDDTGRLLLRRVDLAKMPLPQPGSYRLAIMASVSADPSVSPKDRDNEETKNGSESTARIDRVLYLQFLQENKQFLELRGRYDLVIKRWEIISSIRGWFSNGGFLETETPVRVSCPGVEEFLDFFTADGAFLRTSPELHMKRLLVAGFERIFQIGPCFRKGDHGRLHREEFLMLEWYRTFADLNRIATDVEDLLLALAPHAVDPDYFSKGVEKTTCEALFRQYLELDLQEDADVLRDCAAALGMNFDPDDDWNTLYFRLFLNYIEPYLGHDRPVLVFGYPASQAALAKKKPPGPDEFPTCYRFELYIRGTEIANAFYELCDPEEQEERFDTTRKKRVKAGRQPCPGDPAFLAALSCGMPPSAGIALGVDRLVMHLLNEKSLDRILPF